MHTVGQKLKEKKNPKQKNNTRPQHKKDQAIDKGK